MKYTLNMWVESKDPNGRVVARTNRQTVVVDGLGTKPLARFQQKYGRNISFEYLLVRGS